MKTLSLISLRYLSGAMLLMGSMHLTATEVDAETKPVVTDTTAEPKVSAEDSEKLTPAGSRALSSNEYLDIKKRLCAEDKKNSENAEAPKTEALKGLLKSESAQFKIGGEAKLTYISTHPGAYHFAYAVGLFGDTVTTEDGTVWNVNPNDSYKVFNWLSTDTIVVMPNHAWFSCYGYCLVNLNTDTAVEATIGLYVKPPYHSVFNHRVTLIDDYRQMIWLEDGSVWSILNYDYQPIHWQVGDTVIIGINDGWYLNTNPNILINAVNLVGVRAVCIQY
jgi:hypothetical protein